MSIQYIRQATKAVKLELDLGVARDHVIIQRDLTALIILDKGTGTFTLTVEFPDETTIDLTSTELANGQRFPWDIRHLMLTNTAQSGLTLKLLGEKQQPEQMAKV
jgi:hypothetical protein